jgi:isochorismate pyruvate lyase
MSEDIVQPIECTTMDEVRTGVDAVDRELVALLARRFAYMDAAARIKPSRDLVRDEGRKARVLDNVEALAAQHCLPPERIAAVWEVLVEQSIAYELDTWDSTRV